jgi:hypothetical protein
MRKFLFSFPAVAALFVAAGIAWLAKPAQAQPPVVVELFTSEGCSSCPPADAMLTKLSHQRDTKIAKLILLEEHVEYWNNGGWTDPFSGPTYTQRQYDYTKELHLATAYTPQIVVDGHLQASGNDPHAVEQLILDAAKTPMPAAVTLHLASPGKLQVMVDNAPSAKLDVLLAVTEDDLTNNVRAGENSGRTLTHSAVVREMHRLGVTSDGKFDKSVSLPDKSGWKKDNLRAIVLVEDSSSGAIVGAAELPYAAPSSGATGP